MSLVVLEAGKLFKQILIFSTNFRKFTLLKITRLVGKQEAVYKWNSLEELKTARRFLHVYCKQIKIRK